MARRHRIRALTRLGLALIVVAILSACATGPARDPKEGELIGVWKNGSTTLTIIDAVSFTVKNLSSERVFSEEGRHIELEVSGDYAIDNQSRLDNLRALTLTYDQVGGNTGGLIQAAFDPTTNPVSIVILGGSVDDPAYFRLTKQP